jgi:hypothetical protein
MGLLRPRLSLRADLQPLVLQCHQLGQQAWAGEYQQSLKSRARIAAYIMGMTITSIQIEPFFNLYARCR